MILTVLYLRVLWQCNWHDPLCRCSCHVRGEEMTKLEPSATDGSQEKHAPVVCVEDSIVHVSVGSVHHPMEENHSIQWVYLQTDKGGHRKCLEIGKEPTIRFAVVDENPIAAYAYCNKHGLWKTEI